MEEPAQTVDPISRSDSPSTTASAALTQLPDMSVLAASNVVDTSSLVDLSQHVESQEDNDLSELPLQHPRYALEIMAWASIAKDCRISNGITAPVYTGATPAATSGGMNGTMVSLAPHSRQLARSIYSWTSHLSSFTHSLLTTFSPHVKTAEHQQPPYGGGMSTDQSCAMHVAYSSSCITVRDQFH